MVSGRQRNWSEKRSRDAAIKCLWRPSAAWFGTLAKEILSTRSFVANLSVATLVRNRSATRLNKVSGVSNCSLDQLRQYQRTGSVDCAQEKYNMLDRKLESDLAPFCAQNNIAVLAYTPLANGLLTGKVWAGREFPTDDLRHDNPQFAPEMRGQVRQMLEEMWPVAERHGLTFSQLAIAWTLAQKGITHALVGVRNERQAL